MAEIAGPVTGGVDTHAGTHVAAVVDQVGRVLGTESFPAGATGMPGALGVDARPRRLATGGGGGHRQLRRRAGPLPGLPGVPVLEVSGRTGSRAAGAASPTPWTRSSAAIAALNGEDRGTPKSGDGAVESIRRCGWPAAAPSRHDQAGNQLANCIITAPERLRRLGRRTEPSQRVRARRPLSPAAMPPTRPRAPRRPWRASPAAAQELDTEIAQLEAALEQLVARAAAPEYLALTGVGTLSAAALTRRRRRQPRPDPQRGQRSPPCAASARSMPPPASRNGTGSTTAGTGRPTPRCGGSPSPAFRHLAHQGLLARRIAAGKTTQGNHPQPQALRRPRGLPQAHQARLHPSRRDPVREGRLDNPLTCTEYSGRRRSAAGVSGMPQTRASPRIPPEATMPAPL